MTKTQAQQLVSLCGTISTVAAIITTIGVVFGCSWPMFFLYCVTYGATCWYIVKTLGQPYSWTLFAGAQASNVIAAFGVYQLFGLVPTVLWFSTCLFIAMLVKLAGPVAMANVMDKAIS